MKQGCPNCPQRKLEEREFDEVKAATTTSYIGIVAHFRTGGWLKRAAHIRDSRVCGSYAVQIHPSTDAKKYQTNEFDGEDDDLDDFIAE